MSDAWSTVNPDLQLAWDPTSKTALQRCPRYYEYSVVRGWYDSENPHLSFGALYAECTERYLRARAGRPCGACEGAGTVGCGTTCRQCFVCDGTGRLDQASKAVATEAAVLHALQASGTYRVLEDGDYEWQPWSGEYVQEWRCTGTEPYVNANGRKAKCPYSHAGKWASAPTPDACPSCGSPTQAESHWHPNHPAKHRENLLLAVSEFCDNQPEGPGLHPKRFKDGTIGVELAIAVPASLQAYTGEEYMLVINPDTVNDWRQEVCIVDDKTTTRALNKRYFTDWRSNEQLDTYDMVGDIVFGEEKPVTLGIRATQVTKTGLEHKLQWYTKTDGQRAEMWQDTRYWLRQAEGYAREGYWPRNRAACAGCQFLPVCDRDPAEREALLAVSFKQRAKWDPLNRPGRENSEEEKDDA